jgi:D-xylose transport system ATP-binding protein
MMTKPKVLILDEPTRGVDVGAKVEIYELMNNLVEKGVCVIMISSELQEVLGISDRILVMGGSEIRADFDWRDATQEKILASSIGGRDE